MKGDELQVIGRKKEIEELNNLYNSNKSEFVAIYGRRRIGKTYLVDETFKGRITFRHAGLSPVDENKKGMLKAQLEHFYYSLLIQGMKKSKIKNTSFTIPKTNSFIFEGTNLEITINSVSCSNPVY